MMRILTPEKTLIEVTKAEAFAEARVQFNGSEVRLCQIAKDTKQISGICFTTSTENGLGFLNQNNLIIGNLKSEQAEKMMNDLLTEGYANLSGFEYQPQPHQKKLPVFDNGETLPYYIDNSINNVVYAPARTDTPLGGNGPFSMGTGMVGFNDVVQEDVAEEDEKI